MFIISSYYYYFIHLLISGEIINEGDKLLVGRGGDGGNIQNNYIGTVGEVSIGKRFL